MPLTDKFKDHFSEADRARGAAEYAQGSVLPVEVNALIRATFHFQDAGIQSVEIFCNRTTGRLFWDCTCSLKSGNRNCWHAWASLLASENQNFFKFDASGQQPVVLAPVKKLVDIEFIFILNSLEEFVDDEEEEDFRSDIWKLEIYERGLFNDGTFNEVKPSSISHLGLAKIRSVDHRNLIRSVARSLQLGTHQTASEFPFTQTETAVVLGRLSDAGKLFYFDSDNKVQPLYFERRSLQTPLKLGLKVEKLKSTYRLTGFLSMPPETFELSQDFTHRRGFALFRGSLSYAELEPTKSWIEAFQENEDIVLEHDELATLLAGIYKQKTMPELVLPEEFQYKSLKNVMKTRIAVDNVPASQLLAAELSFRYGDYFINADEKSFRIVNHERREIYERDFTHEFDSETQFASIVQGRRNDENGIFQFQHKNLNDLLDSALQRGWEVVAFKKKVSASTEFDIKTTSGLDWFEIKGKVKFNDDQFLTLPSLLRKVKSNNRLVTLADGSTGLISKKIIETLLPLSGCKVEEDKVTMSNAEMLFHNEELAKHEAFSSDHLFREVQELGILSNNPQLAVPDEKFKGELRPYQQQGLSWLETMLDANIGCLLADDMGLGKTVSVLALLSKKLNGQCLVVVPKSLIHNWSTEVAKFTPHLPVYAHYGTNRRNSGLNLKTAKIVITTYHTLRSDIELLSAQRFEFLILDEAQWIKNQDSQVHKGCLQIVATKKLALTGTPVENAINDLFSILNVVAPGLITPERRKRYAYSQDLKQVGELKKSLQPFILRRTKEAVLTDLPDKTEQVIFCEMSKSDKRDYHHLKTYLWAAIKKQIDTKGLGGAKMMVLEALTKLRQAASHQGILDKAKESKPSAKFEVLLEQLETVVADGHKALVFSSFLKPLEFLKRHLNELAIDYEYMDGSSTDRTEIIESFKTDPTKKVFLMTLKTGGVGLNLTCASYVFILDPWWNPASEAQAIDRTHRIGQKNKVFAYKLISKGTVEEKMLMLQDRKRSVSRALIDDDTTSLTKLSENDLEELFS